MDGGGGDDDGNLMTMLVELLHARKLEKLEEILKEPRLEPQCIPHTILLLMMKRI